MTKTVSARLAFLALLAGGLLFWTHQRRPRDLAVRLDLTSALPGEIVEVDLIVRRGDRALARRDSRYGTRGAPGQVEVVVHAAPGEAEVEATLVYAGRPARRTVRQIRLSENSPASVRAE
jgi:hypothetical protein